MQIQTEQRLIHCVVLSPLTMPDRGKCLEVTGLVFLVDDHGDTGAVPVILLHGFKHALICGKGR